MTRTATAISLILALGACNRAATNNAVAKAPVNVTAPAAGNQAVSTGTPATADPVRAGIAARWPAGAPITAAEVREMIRTTNATDAIVALVGQSENSRWATVLRGIALGEAQWIEIAPTLAPHVDGEAAEGFFAALSETLITSPAVAVRLIGVDGAEGYCSDNGYISDPAQSRAWYAAAIAAVDGVSEPDLQPAKAACLQRLRAEAPR